jgi:phosphatidylinositol 4-kinase B
MGLKEKIQYSKIKFLQQTSIYESFIAKPTNCPRGIFESTVNFFSDLIELGNLLVASPNRKEDLKSYLERVNQKLPATIYIPLTKECYQDLNVISIVWNESRVFSTKERAPYYICLESFYNPTYNEGISRDKKIRSVSRLKREHLKKPHLFHDASPTRSENPKSLRESQINFKLEKNTSS